MENDTEDWSGCFVTREQSEATLLEIEKKLAERFDLSGDIRPQLIEVLRRDDVPEDDLVQDWHCAYASWLDYQENPDGNT